MEQPFQKLTYCGFDIATGTAFALYFSMTINDVLTTVVLAAIGAVVSFCTSLALRRLIKWFKGK